MGNAGVGRIRLGLTAALAVIALGLAGAGGAQAAFPTGSNGLISFGASDGANDDLALMNADGTGRAVLAGTPPPTEERTPAWSPTGRQIAFSRGDSFRGIWLINADGTGATNLSNASATLDDHSPAFSPDGRFIAFTRGDPIQRDIWLMTAGGASQVNVTSTPAPGANESQPDYSPDGRKIVFTAPGTGGGDIWVMDATGLIGGGKVNLTNTPGVSEEDPAFSPDGRSIVFVRAIGNCELFVMPSAGGTGTNISNTPALDECDPVFSPDGKKIAYDVDDGPNNEIYTMNSDGSAQTNITNTAPPLNEFSPSWQPIQKCAGRRVTLVGGDGPDRIQGTKRSDVIATFGGNDVIKGRGGSDRICGGRGKDKLVAGGGAKDLCAGGKGRDSGSGCEKGKL